MRKDQNPEIRRRIGLHPLANPSASTEFTSFPALIQLGLIRRFNPLSVVETSSQSNTGQTSA